MRALGGGWGGGSWADSDVCVWKCWQVSGGAGMSAYGGAGVVWSFDGGRREAEGRRKELGGRSWEAGGGCSVRKPCCKLRRPIDPKDAGQSLQHLLERCCNLDLDNDCVYNELKLAL